MELGEDWMIRKTYWEGSSNEKEEGLKIICLPIKKSIIVKGCTDRVDCLGTALSNHGTKHNWIDEMAGKKEGGLTVEMPVLERN